MTDPRTLAAIATGPALDLPEPHWTAPEVHPYPGFTLVYWGDDIDVPTVLLDAEHETLLIDFGAVHLTPTDAEELARRLYCAAAMAREVAR